MLKEVRHNCSAHRSEHLFIIAISSHSYIKRKQPLRIFLQYSCSVTIIINIVKKYPRRKIHKLNTLIGSSDDSQPQAQNKYAVKNHQLHKLLLPLLQSKLEKKSLIRFWATSICFEIRAHLGHLFA